MVTVYHLDGNDLVLTHYCTSNTQPRMISKGLQGNALTFDFAGGANIDPATSEHMHGARIEFVSADEIKATWQNWNHGKAEPRGDLPHREETLVSSSSSSCRHLRPSRIARGADTACQALRTAGCGRYPG
jgi:hypothetical protein